MAGFLERFGLHRPELRAWVAYDWANSVFITSVAQIFQIYFARVAAAGLTPAEATTRYAFATAVAATIAAVLGPILGALADHAGLKKRLLGVFMGIGVGGTAAMFFIRRGEWLFAAIVYILGYVGFVGSLAFYDALLPHVANESERDRVSTVGYAVGYLGGGLLMLINLAWIQKPHLFGIPDTDTATRLAFLSAAVWWLVFSIPIFRGVSEPKAQGSGAERGLRLVSASFGRLGQTLRELKAHREAFLMLVAFLIYNDGISTIQRMGATYGTEIGIAPGTLIGAILLLQFLGVPFSILFGRIAGWIGTKTALFVTLVVFAGVTVVGYYMRTGTHFMILCLLVGMVQGGAQGLSRSLFSTLIPRHKSGEFFGFYGVFDKFAGVLGPALFGVMTMVTGGGRSAILGLMTFFVVGGVLLALVDVPRGQRAAREAEARALGAPT